MSYPVIETIREIEHRFLDELYTQAPAELQDRPHLLSRPAAVALSRILRCMTRVPLRYSLSPSKPQDRMERLELRIARVPSQKRYDTEGFRHTYLRYYTGGDKFFLIGPLVNKLFFGRSHDNTILTEEYPVTLKDSESAIAGAYDLQFDPRPKIRRREELLHTQEAFQQTWFLAPGTYHTNRK